ncbi:DNA topoisomerase 2-alpha-like, partial [Pelecanus crispus]|uniref:DNA topoisomerase 2-alpha-like n=1 Tax=Pelecanus crispus TaxID=36300 RepID=UPI003F5D0941
MQLEHILLHPDTYIGSVELVPQVQGGPGQGRVVGLSRLNSWVQQVWVFDEDVGLNCRAVTFVPGLYKIFDEILGKGSYLLINAADNKQRDKSMSCIKVTIDVENNTISVWNDGKGIPVVEHKVEKVCVPALIFGQLLTSSNYDDNEKKVTGREDSQISKLCNIFSTKFTVETACREYKKLFKQMWTDNVGKAGEMQLKYFDGEDDPCVPFQPDLSKLRMTILDKAIVALMSRRAYDIAGCTKDVQVFLNGQRLPVKGFCSYVDLCLKDKVDETGNALQVLHAEVNSRWQVCLTLSEKGFQQVSFVNSITTTKGGRHVDYVADQIVTKLIDAVKRKNKNGVGVKPFQKPHIVQFKPANNLCVWLMCFVISTLHITLWRVVIGATRLTQLGPEAQGRHIKQLLVDEHYTGGSADVLQEAKVHLMDVRLCKSSRWSRGAIHAHRLCAGCAQGGIDPCQ